MPFIDLLSKEMSHLPGKKTHELFYPLRFIKSIENPENVRLSAVGVHLFPIDSVWYFILIERSEYNGHHSKQIAFPGGKKDPKDSDLEQTARRESEEEISISMTSAQLIGQLTPVYIPVSNFEVYPFIYIHKSVPSLSKSDKEVNEIFFVKCSDLIDEHNMSIKDIRVSDNSIMKQVPCFILEGKTVWGATALILSELKEILLRISRSIESKKRNKP